MGKAPEKMSKTGRKQLQMASVLMVMGALVTLVPWMASGQAQSRGLAALTPIGVMVLLAGAVLAWVALKESGRRQAALKRARQEEGGSGSLLPPSQTEWSEQTWSGMSWLRFDAVVEALFQQEGYQTRLQPHARGTDLWLASRQQPGGLLTLVRCLHGQGEPVDETRLRELLAVMKARQIGRACFATASGFTGEAMLYAQVEGLELLSQEELLARIRQRSPEQQQDLLRMAAA